MFEIWDKFVKHFVPPPFLWLIKWRVKGSNGKKSIPGHQSLFRSSPGCLAITHGNIYVSQCWQSDGRSSRPLTYVWFHVVSCWSLEWTIVSPWCVYGGIIVPFCPFPCAKSSTNLEHNCLDLVCSFINVAPKTTEWNKDSDGFCPVLGSIFIQF